MIWTTKEIGLITKKVKILPKISLDHNPMMWYAKIGRSQSKWKLNEDLLNQQILMDFLKGELNTYFQTKLNREVKIQAVWEAHKAVIRGNLIALNSKDEKEKQAKFQEIQNKISQKEKELKRKPGKKIILRDIRMLQEKIANFANEDTCVAI